MTLAYGAATGAKQRTATTSGVSGRAAIAVSPDGSEVFVTGQGGVDHTYDTSDSVAALDAATGNALWSARLGNGNEYAASVAVNPDSSKVFVTGTPGPAKPPDGAAYYYETTAYDTVTGAVLWTHNYDWPATRSESFAAVVAVSPNESRVFVTGYGIRKSYRGELRGPTTYGTVAYRP